MPRSPLLQVLQQFLGAGRPGSRRSGAGFWGVWKSLDYANYDPSLFQYSYQSDGKTFTVKAVGDAGCRGEIVTYSMTGTAIRGNPVVEFTEPR